MLLFKKLPESFTNAQEKTYSNNIFSENAAKPPPLCLPPRERLCLGIAVSPFRSLPHWGRGTAPAVDRVLSFIVDLRCISSPSFIPLVPYPARSARHLPHAGKALFGDSGALVSQPFPLGKGDRAAVDRVLSYIVDLRRISHFARRKVLNEL